MLTKQQQQNRSKMPMGLHHLLENQLGHCPRFQDFRIHSLSTPGGSKLSLFSHYGQRFSEIGKSGENEWGA